MPNLNVVDTAGFEAALDALRAHIPDSAESVYLRAEESARIILALDLHTDMALAALYAPLLETGVIDKALLKQQLPAPLLQLVRDVLSLPRPEPLDSDLDKGKSDSQAENLRKMLLAIVRDVRVIVVRLAETLAGLRQAKHAGAQEQRHLATQVRQIYAPLANRLGIWELKWQLEDLAFRYLEPQAYRQIARFLRERRSERERYIARTAALLREKLVAEGLEADVQGRPKHIYSIWRKMQRKDIAIEQLYDIRAVRVLVNTVADCYACLGIVHSLWPHIPRELDDYIALPKGNFYRSLHTAVIGPGSHPLEIQIRTQEMHQHAELGIAAHWRYKEGVRHDPALESRIGWMRQFLDPEYSAGGTADFIENLRTELVDERVYALTPQGRVIDLPHGATPLDFAYYVHTDVGHRCRGAKVNGRMVPLTHVLKSGDQVEIITGRQIQPSRDWLIVQSGYLATSRARNKVRAWYRQQDRDQNIAAGHALLDRELNRLGLANVNQEEFSRHFTRYKNLPDFLAALGTGDITTMQLGAVAIRKFETAAKPGTTPRPASRTRKTPRRQPGVLVDGVGNLMAHIAGCCQPFPGEAIVGYLTQGQGVSIHRQDCANLLRLSATSGSRIMAVSWSATQQQSWSANIRILAHDRRGLINDITNVAANEKVNINALNTHINANDIAEIHLRIEVGDIDQLSRVLHRINQLPNVIEARRNAGGDPDSGRKTG